MAGPGQSESYHVSETTSPTSPDAHYSEARPVASRVIARVSTHILREERAYHICKTLISSADPDGHHIIRPVDMVRLTDDQGDDELIACIFEDPGPNYLEKVVDFGPAWFYYGAGPGEKELALGNPFVPKEAVTLETFLDFAIGATECLEIFHRGERAVHGAIRGDAFTMNIETGEVKLAAIESGLRSFENGLTSTAWSTLAREVDAKTRLCESLS